MVSNLRVTIPVRVLRNGGRRGIQKINPWVCEASPVAVTCKADAEVHRPNLLAQRHLRVPISPILGFHGGAMRAPELEEEEALTNNLHVEARGRRRRRCQAAAAFQLRLLHQLPRAQSLADDNAVFKVSQSINAARFLESTLKEFRAEWVDKISTVILRAFDARSRDYLRNKRQWQEHSEGPSRAVIESSGYMQGLSLKMA
ncbi:hypothetical protein BRADI_3g35855v3 [Brachypodium distachyon]|uniref:Uncharacterized protein n=1 Tax=Brachypodium distachyon TaxID=15368 RepID=A0A0Q3Q9E4_BRADI|nr:hypothetical protein BRADI_3g35855v3 [Brachypodium distachyon]